MSETHVQYGVRWPGGEIERRPAGLARNTVAYHSNPRNGSRWIGQVWLVRREVTYGDWEQVTEQARTGDT